MRELVYNPKTKMLKFCLISRNNFRNKCLKYKSGKVEPLFEASEISQANKDAGSRECDIDFLTMKGSKKIDQDMIELIKKAQLFKADYMKATNNDWFLLK